MFNMTCQSTQHSMFFKATTDCIPLHYTRETAPFAHQRFLELPAVEQHRRRRPIIASRMRRCSCSGSASVASAIILAIFSSTRHAITGFLAKPQILPTTRWQLRLKSPTTLIPSVSADRNRGRRRRRTLSIMTSTEIGKLDVDLNHRLDKNRRREAAEFGYAPDRGTKSQAYESPQQRWTLKYHDIKTRRDASDARSKVCRWT